jgi:hypothetical protein
MMITEHGDGLIALGGQSPFLIRLEGNDQFLAWLEDGKVVKLGNEPIHRGIL